MSTRQVRVRAAAIALLALGAATGAGASPVPVTGVPAALVFGLPNAIGTFGLFDRTMAQSRYLLGLVYEPLVRVNASQELEPAIAKAWRVSPDKTSIIFEIVGGHRFSDGSPVTAVEAAQSLIRSCAPGADSRKDFTSILGCGSAQPAIRAVGPDRLVIGYKGAVALLLYQLSGNRAGIGLARSGFKLGSGLYQVDSLSDASIRLSPNPASSNIGAPALLLKKVGEERLAQVIQQERLDGTIMFRLSSIASPPPGYHALDDQANITLALVPNLRRAPFNDPEFRTALSSLLTENPAFTTCHPEVRAAYGLVPLGIGGSIDHLPHAAYSAQAIPDALLAKLRKKYAARSVTIQRHAGRRDECEESVILGAFAKLGVKAQLHYHDNYDTLLPLYVSHDLDAFLELYIFPSREAMPVFNKFALSGDNLLNLDRPIIEDSMGAVWDAQTNSQRYQAYRAVNQGIQDKALLFSLYYLRHRNVLSDCIDKVPPEFVFNPFLGLAKLRKKDGCR